jgi:hypothetical protein
MIVKGQQHPIAVAMINSGDLIVQRGAPLSAEGATANAVLTYLKAVPEQGGLRSLGGLHDDPDDDRRAISGYPESHRPLAATVAPNDKHTRNRAINRPSRKTGRLNDVPGYRTR